ncbi:MAG: helix-turn-helix transcriptional regulator [Gammaproteobacteria bacterium]|jgi:transcriptional regulator with XRE-family HTH domain|nr:helix-turn-helix transcriptional regulator [Gammaproteobacteria bacterium]MBT3488409.1 helix-turn-helix transcriptional regulator [Gammaproteobacteria bacterium]MBT3717655.1 helix-turn-helix transcriptional regulator [Gammaproteobacteria bacterium]MBT3844333.1 helix-turn-helix transcriptional regulator [Gammaproteobacteria bacterium]MBT3893795.1 helix-turn-helix transcriptional regulator [Gammaproteobacteria bacterium]
MCDPHVVFGTRLRQARQQCGLSQKQLGLEIGIDPATASPRINQYENNRHRPGEQTIAKLSDTLQVPTAFFFAEEDELAQLILLCVQLSKEQQRVLSRYIEEKYGVECCIDI